MAASVPTVKTAWARNLAAPVRHFLSTETGGAVALLVATIAALAWANSPGWHSYESVWTTHLSIRVGDTQISRQLREWINEGLMTFYFLVVGLEAKRERVIGQLREGRRIASPVVAALCGMAVPVLIFLAINGGGHGWGAAMSTDTAFALGLLALVARDGTRLRIRLLTASVVDDLVALVVIAVAYSGHVSLTPLLIAGALLALLVALRFAPETSRAPAATAVGIGIWIALFESGVDPVISGLAIGLITTAYLPARQELERAVELTRLFREQPTPELARSAQRGLALAVSPNDRLQYRLHPWTSFLIVPLFALANAGIHVDSSLLGAAIRSPVTWGIFAGYVVGKPLGIIGGAWLATRRWTLGLQRSLSWPSIAGLGSVAGIGFTVALLIASRAFEGQRLAEAKLGVLAAAVAASLLAWAVFRAIGRLPVAVRARQLIGTAEELVDLAVDVDPSRDHIRGSARAPVTLLEYGDYQCPYCGQAEVVVRELLDSFGDDLRYVWRHLPLSDVHTNAQGAAEAAEAAAAQGAFWPMHDTLLAHQDQLSAMDLVRYANDLGLDARQFTEDLRRHRFADRVSEDVASADASGVAGTPTFFVNGRRHEGAYDIATLSAAVRDARGRALLRRNAQQPGTLQGT